MIAFSPNMLHPFEAKVLRQARQLANAINSGNQHSVDELRGHFLEAVFVYEVAIEIATGIFPEEMKQEAAHA